MADYKTQAQALAERLNNLTAEEQNDNWWDIVEDTDYDRAATEAADPSANSDVVVFPDGTRLEYWAGEQTWKVAI